MRGVMLSCWGILPCIPGTDPNERPQSPGYRPLRPSPKPRAPIPPRIPKSQGHDPRLAKDKRTQCIYISSDEQIRRAHFLHALSNGRCQENMLM